MEVQGKIHRIGNDEQVSATFKKRELVIATQETYPQFISINFVQDKCDLIDPYQLGEEVKVSINLRGREWISPQGETKYFNDIQGWRIERLANSQNSTPAPSTERPQANMSNSFVDGGKEMPNSSNTEEFEDLPF